MKTIVQVILGMFLIIVLLTFLMGFEGTIIGLIFGIFGILFIIINKEDAKSERDAQ